MTLTFLLSSSIWERMYSFCRVMGDEELCSWMSTIGLIYTAVVGVYSIFQPAPYGRYAKAYFGPTINVKLAWMMQESPAFIIPAVLLLTTPSSQLTNFPNIVAIFLFMLHYFQRSFVFPFALASQAKPAPVATMLSAVVFCSYNGFLQGHHLLNVYQVSNSIALYLGAPLFLLGMYINIRHDRILISLRKTSKQDSEGKTEYRIPRGFLFEYISGANYFGEILEWWALALITQGYPQIVFATFSSVFLGLRSYHHHTFYKKTFGNNYPANRKAIIPFVI